MKDLVQLQMLLILSKVFLFSFLFFKENLDESSKSMLSALSAT